MVNDGYSPLLNYIKLIYFIFFYLKEKYIYNFLHSIKALESNYSPCK